MKTIKLKPVNVTEKILLRLEKKGLIRTLRPTDKVLRSTAKHGLVDTIYSSPGGYGTHKLICVRSDNDGKINLNSHPHNEEFILINTTGLKLKPVVMVIALSKYGDIERKAGKGRLTSRDFIFLRLKYNDHGTCVFTMLKDTPHCEVSPPVKGESPIFFVTEPSKLKINRLRLHEYRLTLG